MAADESEMADLWQARKDLAFASRVYDPDREPIHPGDVTVPISSYPELIRYAKDLGDEAGLLVPCFGHAGDGNLHYTMLADHDDPDEMARAEEIYGKVVEHAIAVGGTATGEHGIGLGKRQYLEAEHGEVAVEAMRGIKRALDPRDTLNPGKIFPETADGERMRVETVEQD
jgi:D-lactate dehydrogenase (cytochrome)